MGIKLNYIAPLLAAGAAAVAITAAPIAAAASAPAPHGACDAGVSGSICDTPGDVGITTPFPRLVTIPTEARAFCSGATAVAFTAAASTAVGAADTGAKPCRVRSPQHHRLLGVTWGAWAPPPHKTTRARRVKALGGDARFAGQPGHLGRQGIYLVAAPDDIQAQVAELQLQPV